MNDLLLDLIGEVVAEKRRYQNQPEAPCYPDRLTAFNSFLVEKKIGPLPPEWNGLMERVNGLTWNGVTLYGVDEDGDNDPDNEPFAQGGLLEINLRPRPKNKPVERYLLVGQTDLDHLAYDWQEGLWLTLDLADWEPSTIYRDFDDFLQDQANKMLA